MKWKHFWKDTNYQSSLRKIDILDSPVSIKDNEYVVKSVSTKNISLVNSTKHFRNK